jgi:hypothetical protein
MKVWSPFSLTRLCTSSCGHLRPYWTIFATSSSHWLAVCLAISR